MSPVDAEVILRRNVDELRALLVDASGFVPQIAAAADKLATSFLLGGKLLACGNGGGAMDASHLTTEFVCRYSKERRPYPAISLATQGGDLTAIGNDYEFNDIFARQIEAFGQPGDVLMAFTTSGRSENIRRALIAGGKQKMVTISFLGKGGGNCTGLGDIELLVDSTTTARIQEVHKLLLHTICELADQRL